MADEGHVISGRRRLGSRLRSAFTALLLAAGCLTAVVVSALVVAPVAAQAGTAPAPPPGWSTVFTDNFAGSAGSAPSAANWFYDIGTGYGTGEIEHTTNSTSNVYLDGNGDLVLKAIDNSGTWTSGRIESTRDDFEAPAGGELEMTASIEQPNPANGLGYWPAFWALGSPMRTGGGWPQSGELDMMEDVNGLNEASQTLHDSANSPGHALIACPTTGCQTGYNTYSVIINRTNTSAETLEYVMDGVVESTITEASVGTAAWQAAIDHGFFIIFDLAMGGNYPNGICNCTTPTAATTSGASMSVQYVAVYEEGGNSTPTGTATATGQVTATAGCAWPTRARSTSRATRSSPTAATATPASSGRPTPTAPCGPRAAAWTWCRPGPRPAPPSTGTPVTPATPRTGPTSPTASSSTPNSGLCLTDPGGNPSAQLELEACTDSAAQVWNLPSGGATGNTVTVGNPGNQTATVGTAASLQVGATDSASGQTLTYSATGLPAGLSINSSTGLISGTPTTAGTSSVTVTATDTTGAHGTASFTWTVNSGSTGTGSGGVDISAGGPAAAPFVADEDFTGGATAATTNAISTTGDHQPGPAVGLAAQPLRQLHLHHPRPHRRRELHGPARLRRGVLDRGRIPHLQRPHQRHPGADQLRHLRHRRRRVQGGRRVVHRDRQQRRRGHHPVRHRQGQRPGQRHRDLARAAAPATPSRSPAPAARPAPSAPPPACRSHATDSASGQTLTYSATGLPAGLSINSSTGLITGTPTTVGSSSVTVKATDTTGASGTATFTWTENASTTGTGGVDISAGGPAAAPFVADEDYTGGATAATTTAISTTGITNPAPQSVWQHNRYGNFTYTIPGLTAGANYTVRLDFAEEYWTAAGSRTFNVLINGTQVLTNFDIFATAGGEFKGVAESFTATASSAGAVTIQFVTVKDNAQVNGIQITPA